ncbi:hypothetical protein T12_15839 [Trichinella patagoniensis]|uniref:Uncharacterized protein n=1 Tax=Trichinella patagoniensis TaxID=990121 RepID=A0A0V0ZCL0_9BILA|nr:hypothetical protein T12_15839 [Trichinella patagoniensis]
MTTRSIANQNRTSPTINDCHVPPYYSTLSTMVRSKCACRGSRVQWFGAYKISSVFFPLLPLNLEYSRRHGLSGTAA